MRAYQQLFLLPLLLILSLHVNAAERIALVLGNSDYQVGRLKNPINDAEAVAKSLKDDLGFEVILATNTNRIELYKSVQRFRKKITKDSVALFYYSGHGIEVAGKNYLLPVDNQDIHTQEDVPMLSVSANDILIQMEASASKLNIMILDACRDNPLPSTSKSANRGLSRIEGSRGSIIAYATRAGQVAQDGITNHSPFTQALLNNLTKTGYSVAEMFNSVGLEVIKSTNNVQVPWVSSSPVPRVFLASNNTYSQNSNQNTSSTQNMGDLTSAELSAWQGVRQCDDVNKVLAFIRDFPKGTFTSVAKNCLDKLTANQQLALYIDTDPSNAKVRFLNVDSIYQYGIKLKPARYQLEVSHSGYETIQRWVTLSHTQQAMVIVLNKKEQVANLISAKEAYDIAINLVLKERKYDQAIPALQRFIQNYPTSGYLASSHYWLGQLLFRANDLANAVKHFEIILNNFPKSKKRPDAMLKLAMITQKQGEPTKALNLYQQITIEFPNSSAAKLARARAESLE